MLVTECDTIKLYFLRVFILPKVIFVLTWLLIAYLFHVLMNISITNSLPLNNFFLNTRGTMYSAIHLTEMFSPSCSSFGG